MTQVLVKLYLSCRLWSKTQ